MQKVIVKSILFIICIIIFSDSANARDSINIAGEKVSLSTIKLTTDFSVKGNTSTSKLYYTFYLDQRDLKIADNYRDKYLYSNNSYRVMSAIILLYVEEVFKNYPCKGKNKCVKNIYVSIKDFFDYLNSNPKLRTKFLTSWSSKTLLTPRYKHIDSFLFEVAQDVGYAFYGISYMRVDSLYTRTLLDKMIFSIRHDGP